MDKKPFFDDVAPWPESAKPAVASIGHNRPPLEELIPEEFRAALLSERPDFLEKFSNLIEAANRARAVDEETLGRCCVSGHGIPVREAVLLLAASGFPAGEHGPMNRVVRKQL